MTMSGSYFNRDKPSQSATLDAEALANLYKFHKGATYSIGNSGTNGVYNSSTKDSYGSPIKTLDEKLPGRRNQDNNVNLKKNLQIGISSAVQPAMSTDTAYKRMVGSGIASQAGRTYAESKSMAKEYAAFVNSKKFDYGMDPDGGIKGVNKHRPTASVDRLGNTNQYNNSEMQQYKMKGEA